MCEVGRGALLETLERYTMETKRQKFQRMLAIRLPKAVKAVELLGNLARKSDYEWSTLELQNMADTLDDAVDDVLEKFGKKPVAAEPEPAELTYHPVDGADYVAPEQRSEVRWAHDALKRGDKKLAEDRLRRVIEHWIAEERA